MQNAEISHINHESRESSFGLLERLGNLSETLQERAIGLFRLLIVKGPAEDRLEAAAAGNEVVAESVERYYNFLTFQFAQAMDPTYDVRRYLDSSDEVTMTARSFGEILRDTPRSYIERELRKQSPEWGAAVDVFRAQQYPAGPLAK